MKKRMDHWHFQEKITQMSEEQLNLTIRNAKKRIAADPKGINKDYYADEINYSGMELQKRRNEKRRWVDELQMKNKGLMEVKECSG